MINQDKGLPRQMNGPVINSMLASMDRAIGPSAEIADYLYGLSLATAQEAELENIGKLIGYPRPLMPAGFSEENTFVLGTLPLSQDQSQGLSAVGTMLGGELVGYDDLQSVKMNLGQYRQALQIMARIKARGLTLKSIDEIAALTSNNYTISWDGHGDITVAFSDPIGFARVWILSQLFYKVSTAPQILVTAAT